MWFVIGMGLILAAIIVAGIVSDVRRRRKLRRLQEQHTGRGVDAAARLGRASVDERAGRSSGTLGYGHGTASDFTGGHPG